MFKKIFNVNETPKSDFLKASNNITHFPKRNWETL